MTTVAIIGAGDLGGAVAWAVAQNDRVGRVLLIDDAVKAAAGKALDIQQAGAVERFHTRLEATDDLTRLIGCSACVLADRFGLRPPDWTGEEAVALLQRVAPHAGEAPVIFAGATQAPVIVAAAREVGMPRAQLIGSAPEALASAITAIVAMEARCSPKEIRLTVLGTPGRFVVPWSEASIGGYALDRVLTQVQLSRVEARAERLWPPGPYTLGRAAAEVACAVVESARRSFSVLTMLSGEFGVRGRVGALPALLSSTGIVHTRVPTLNTRERVLLDTALGT